MNAGTGQEKTLYGVAYAYQQGHVAGPTSYTLWVPPVLFFTDAIVFGSDFPLKRRLGGDRTREYIWTEMNAKIHTVIEMTDAGSVTSDLLLGLLLESLPKSYAVPASEFTEVRMSRKKGWMSPRVDVRLVEKSGRKHRVQLAYPVTRIPGPTSLVTLKFSAVDEIAEGFAAAFGDRFRRD
jgi:hypothetical protein